MKKPRTFWAAPVEQAGARSQAMSWIEKGMVIALLFVAALVLVGCANPEPIAVVPPTATVYAPLPTDAPPPPPEPTPAAMSFPLPASESEAIEVEAPDDSTCVACHTDEETLKAVATEIEQEESLSEGEG